jgi:hypothetical protein
MKVALLHQRFFKMVPVSACHRVQVFVGSLKTEYINSSIHLRSFPKTRR